MSGMCAEVHLFNSFPYVAAVLVMVVGLQGAAPNASDLADYFISGRPTNYSPETFPVILYKLVSGTSLAAVRTVVPRGDGLYSIDCDLHSTIAVAYPHINPTAVSVIHYNDPGREDTVTFNPENLITLYSETALAQDAGGSTYEIFPLLSKDTSGSERVTLIRVLLNSVSSGARVYETDSNSYLGIRMSGAPGGPAFTITFLAKAANNGVYIDARGIRVKLLDLPSEYAPRLNGRDLAIVAADERFLVFCVAETPDQLAGASSRVLFVVDRVRGAWREIIQPGNSSRTRLAGPWVATIQQQSRDAARSEPQQMLPTEEGENAEVRRAYDGFQASISDIPGVLILDNLYDKRRIVINTDREDSEVLAANSNEAVYRVNEEIYQVKLIGSKLGQPEILVKGPEVPGIHWAFAGK